MNKIYKLIIVILLLPVQFIYSQNYWEVDSELTIIHHRIHDKIDSVFMNLDTAEFNSGFLANRIFFPLSGMQNFDGTSDSIINATKWFQMYFELTNYAAYRPHPFPDFTAASEMAEKKIREGLVPLGIINLQYHLVKQAAIDSGWLYLQNEQVVKSSSAPSSPYELKKAFAISPLNDDSLTSPLTFTIDSAFYYTNSADTLQRIEIDFGDGSGVHSLQLGDQIMVNFSNAGAYTITSRAISANDTLQSKSTVFISGSSAQNKLMAADCNPTPGDCDKIEYGHYVAPDEIWDAADGLVVQDNPLTNPYWHLPAIDLPGEEHDHPEQFTSARAYIKYGCGNEDMKLRKPFIFVDGVNFSDEDLDYVGCKGKFVQYGDVGWPQIIMGIDNNDLHGIEKLKLEKLPPLIKKLCKDGYDLIMFDYQDGDYYMQKNAMVLVELIKKVNNELVANGSKNQVVLMGASMGGQVTRFALKYMENKFTQTNDQQWNHNVRLWIPYDSPHRGANIPLGMQYAVKWMTITEAVTKAQFFHLYTPAAPQLLLYHVNATSKDGTPHEHPLRTVIYSDPNMGFPEKPRKVAIANGSGYNVKQGNNYSSENFNPGDLIYQMESSTAADNTTLGFNVSMDMYSLPADLSGTEHTIFKGELTTNTLTTILSWGWPLTGILTTFINTLGGSEVKIKNTYPYDNISGAGRVSIYTFGKKLNGLLFTDVSIQKNYHCFIPTASALGLYNFNDYLNVNLNQQFNSSFGNSGSFIYPFYHSSLTPFDAVYAPYDNEMHMEITDGSTYGSIADNSKWIKEEVSPDDLFLQNRPLSNMVVNNSPHMYNFEARNDIYIGSDVDPIKSPVNSSTRTAVGDFIINGGATADIRAGHEIVIKDNTWLKRGSNVRLYIQPFQCEAVCRLANSNNNEKNGTMEEIRAAAVKKDWTDVVYDEVKKTEPKPGKENGLSGQASIFPNPFSDHLHIAYAVAEEGPVTISVYTITGQKISELVSTHQHLPGSHTATLDARKFSAGIYCIRIAADSKTETMKIVKIK